MHVSAHSMHVWLNMHEMCTGFEWNVHGLNGHTWNMIMNGKMNTMRGIAQICMKHAWDRHSLIYTNTKHAWNRNRLVHAGMHETFMHDIVHVVMHSVRRFT